MNRQIVIFLWLLMVGTLTLEASGWITVRTSVLGAQVTIDQMESEVMRVKEQCFAVEEGLHLVVLDKEGYYPQIDTITIREGENVLLPMWLEPMTEKTTRATTEFKRVSWDYQLDHGLFRMRWVGIGGGLGTGLNIHLSLFDLRYGLLTIDPCLWGINLPFFRDVTHVKVPWLVHNRDRRSIIAQYQMAIPTLGMQLYYTPMVGVVLPFTNHMAFHLSAAPQISWTLVEWSYQTRDLPSSYAYEFTDEPFPTTGLRFDPVWFSVQAGILFNGNRSDVLAYFKYQDGCFLGIDFRF